MTALETTVIFGLLWLVLYATSSLCYTWLYFGGLNKPVGDYVPLTFIIPFILLFPISFVVSAFIVEFLKKIFS